MTELDRKVVNLIRERRLAPRPPIFFAARQLMFWTLATLCAVLASISFAVLIYTVAGHPVIVRELAAGIPFDDSFQHVVPIWGAAATLCIAGSVLSLRRTRGGHRFPTLPVVVMLALGNLALGGALHRAVEAGWHVHEIVEAQLPAYERFTEAPDDKWRDRACRTRDERSRGPDASRQADCGELPPFDPRAPSASG